MSQLSNAVWIRALNHHIFWCHGPAKRLKSFLQNFMMLLSQKSSFSPPPSAPSLSAFHTSWNMWSLAVDLFYVVQSQSPVPLCLPRMLTKTCWRSPSEGSSRWYPCTVFAMLEEGPLEAWGQSGWASGMWQPPSLLQPSSVEYEEKKFHFLVVISVPWKVHF